MLERISSIIPRVFPRGTVFVGDEIFKSKNELHKFTRSMLDNCMNKAHAVLSAREHSFLLHLIQRHSEAKEKIGCGIKKFIVMRNMGGHPHLEFTRLDGTRASISWRNCVNPGLARSGPKQRLLSAMRNAVQKQVLAFKQSGTTCASCGVESFDLDTDHEMPTFSELTDAFLETQLGAPIEFTRTRMSGHIFLPTSAVFELRWQQFHKDRARLQLLCVPCHKLKTFDAKR